jgi:hypothetical protein
MVLFITDGSSKAFRIPAMQDFSTEFKEEFVNDGYGELAHDI